MNEDTTMSNNIEILIDSHHGVYVPQIFAERVADGAYRVYGNRRDDMIELRAGPDAEGYWEAWTQVLDNVTVYSRDGRAYQLHQDGDLFAVAIDALGTDEVKELLGDDS